ncbi:uncharacterized protein LOC142589915 isoform X6 [Dermacentor variabilis]|uniref:uncharacterized protein LOC142589915 isoform X6 n=1 Tax=Dermacentor variabilis TaxID=34621 RepID=UPI003F5B2D5A
MRNEVTVAMGHSMGGHWFWLDHLSPEALRPIWIVLGGHWFWATSHPKPCDLFGSTSVVIGSGPPLTRSLATYLDRPRIEQRTGSAKGDQYTEPAARNVESTSTASMDAAIAAILFIPLTATQAGIVNALWQSIACIAVQCGAPTLRSAITDSLQSSEVSSSG